MAQTGTLCKENSLEELKQRIYGKLVDRLNLAKVGELDSEVLRREIRLAVQRLCENTVEIPEGALLSRSQREQLVDEVLDETFDVVPWS